MTKSVKRHVKRTGKYGSRENGGGSLHGRSPARPAGLGQGKSRSSLADNKCVRIVGLLFLPVLFGIFGFIMFPPPFNVDNDVISNTSLTNESSANRGSNNISSQTVDRLDQINVSKTANTSRSSKKSELEDDPAVSKETKRVKRKKNQSSPQSQKSQEKSKVGDREGKSPPSSKIKNFKPTILDSLNIREIEVEGRRVRPVELTENHPESPVKVYLFEGFLTDKECTGLKRVHQHHIQDTEVNDPIICFDGIHTLRKHLKDAGQDIKVSSRDFTEGTSCINASFSSQLKPLLTWSYSTAFYPGESKFSTKFEDRVFAATGLRQASGGKFQITSYPEGIGYKTHTDCVLDDPEKRDRFGTILVYLQDVKEGGETKFPELGISVKPRKGRAVVWNNMNSSGDCEPVSVHEAARVVDGHKFIIQRWYYYESFQHLGKRSKEPLLPHREPGQPRVNCDEYEHGSCRWYDEWNFEHLLDYRAVQRGLS